MTAGTFQIELEGLIKLLAQHLYADPDVFLREMVQNAHDSIARRRLLAQERGEPVPPEPRIQITVSESDGTITVHDNGTGLTREEIADHLATIGRSGTGELRARLREGDRSRAVDLIGQFGIGLLSAFIVAAEVRVLTRSADSAEGLLFVSDGGQAYEVEPADRTPIGSSVTLVLRPEHSRYLDRTRLESIVRTYADFIGMPIYVNDDGEPVNAVDGPWHRNYADQADRLQSYLNFWDRRFPHEHALHVFAVDEKVEWEDLDEPDGVGRGHVGGVLAITDRHVPDVNARGMVDVYIERMFINAANRDVLPPWARFIQGVLESDALVPNAARDNVVRNAALTAVRERLGQLIIDELTTMSQTNPSRCKEILRWHSYHVLAMSVQDEHEEFFRAIADLVPLESDQGPMSVAEYLVRAPLRTDGSKQISYIVERGSANQYYLLAGARSMTVFNCAEPFAERFLERYTETWPDRAKLARLDLAESDLIFEQLDDDERPAYRDLEAAYPALFPELMCEARVSRFKPAEVPAVLTESNSGRNRRQMKEVAEDLVMPQFIRTMVKGFLDEQRIPVKLHLNADNETVQRLVQRGDLRDEISRNALGSLFNNAVMFQARAISPQTIRTMFAQYNRIIELMLALSADKVDLQRDLATRHQELAEARGASQDAARTAHVSCFVALPFGNERAAAVFRAIEAVLEAEPYCWEVLRADDRVVQPGLWDNLKAMMLEAHCFIAIVDGDNPNVLIEVGRMEAVGRPLLLVTTDPHAGLPTDLEGRLYERVAVEPGSPAELEASVRDMLERQTDFLDQSGTDRYLSEVTLTSLGMAPELARKLSRRCRTWSALREADAEALGAELSIRPLMVQLAQDELPR